MAIGLGVGLTGSLLPLIGLLTLVQRDWRRVLGGVVLLACACSYGAALAHRQPKNGQVAGRFHIERVSRTRKAFARGWVLHGRLNRAPVHIYLKSGWDRPPANCDYWIEGVLEEGRFLKVDPTIPWIPVRGSWSSAQWRLQTREWIAEKIKHSVKHHRSGLFLTALMAGDLEDSTLLFGFARLGLLHLMAISGFHFSIVAFVAGLLVRCWLHLKGAAILLVTLLTLYLGVVGAAPSVLRAWVMAVALFAGWIWERPHNSLHALGVALCAVLLWDPHMLLSLGFQYSFLCTGAILLYFGPCERLLRRVMGFYTLEEVKGMGRIDQIGAMILALLRRALALTLAVHLAALPLTLFFFHRFPLMSLLFNLCFPIALAVVLALSLIGLAIPPLLTLAGELGRAALSLIESVPASLDYTLRVPPFPALLLLAYFVACVLFWARCLRGDYKEHPLRPVLP